jgi:signal peptidase I
VPPDAPRPEEPPEGAIDPFGDPDSIERLRNDARARGERKDAARSFWRELPILVVVALVVAVVIKTFLVQAFYIPSASMRDTLLEGDRVMVNKLAYRFGEPARGDVIVFDSPLVPHNEGESFLGAVVRNIGEALGISTPDTALIKRVVAVGGETIEIRRNTVFIDGVAIAEPYLREGSEMPAFGPVTVPEGEVFVMGDNRNQSEDSRRFGTIPVGDIIGRAFVRVWPPSRWGGL